MRARAICILICLVCGVAEAQTPSVSDADRQSQTQETGGPVRNGEAPDEDAFEPPHVPGTVAPYAAVLRSAIVPGWGQYAIRQPVQGTVFAASALGLLAGWWVVRQDYTSMYDGEYIPAVQNFGVTSDEAESIYLEVNRRFKVARLLLGTAVGIWAFSLIDAYVDANIYNAELRAEDVLREAETVRSLRFGLVGEKLSLRLELPF